MLTTRQLPSIKPSCIWVVALILLLSSHAAAQSQFDANTFFVSAQGGGIYTVSGDTWAFEGQFVQTTSGISPGVAVFDGALFYAAADGIVWKYAPDGTATQYASGFVTGFLGLAGIVFDVEGYLYVAELGANNIWIVPPGGGDLANGDFSLLSGSGSFNGPLALTLGLNGEVFVSEFYEGIVTAVECDGSNRLIADSLSQPIGLQIETDGTLYISEHSANKVTKVTASGVKSTLFGGLGFPEGHTYDDQGNRYVLDSVARTIVRFDSSGQNQIVASTPGTPLSSDQMVWFGGGAGAYPISPGPSCFTTMNPDSDNDGVPDNEDICPGGDDNTDSDGDLVPDFCDPCPLDADNDADGDGVCGDVDICILGDDSLDFDGDDTPDACDVCPIDPGNDADGDGICESDDNCEAVFNTDQTDSDGDGYGDACDLDSDNDGLDDGDDNCPFDANPDQADFDNDGLGDACDADIDDDGVIDSGDQCLGTMPGEAVNTSGCSIAEICPCAHPEGGSKWKNHGAYVRCVAHTSEDFVAAGLINESEKDAAVSSAGQSSCGHKN